MTFYDEVDPFVESYAHCPECGDYGPHDYDDCADVLRCERCEHEWSGGEPEDASDLTEDPPEF
jgi:uncharacterized Zn ribbon protein